MTDLRNQSGNSAVVAVVAIVAIVILAAVFIIYVLPGLREQPVEQPGIEINLPAVEVPTVPTVPAAN